MVSVSKVNSMRVHLNSSSSPPAALRPERSVEGLLVFRRTFSTKQKSSGIRVVDGAPILRLNVVCPYYTMFPVNFPLRQLARARTGEWVLDPFCGRGTTLFAARLLGLPCVGIDSNPIAAAIAAAKLTNTTAEAVVMVARRILHESAGPLHLPEGLFWKLCFHSKTLRDICILREHLMESSGSSEEVMLRALMLGILHGRLNKGVPTYLSNQMPRTYATKPNGAIRYWQKMGLTSPPKVDVLAAICRRAHYILSSIPLPVNGSVYFGDARHAESLLSHRHRFSWVITSPPYLGMRTYRSDQWLRNWFLGGDANAGCSQDGQITHQYEKFTNDLATVWRAVACRCVPGAHLVIRFGYLPGTTVDAHEILRTSLRRSGAGWRIRRWVDAGSSSNGKRQAEQFGRFSEKAASEFDAYAKLEV